MRQKEEWQRQKETMDAEEAKLNKIKLEQEKIASEQRQQELNQLRIKKENYLKNRSAEDATKDTLRDFM